LQVKIPKNIFKLSKTNFQEVLVSLWEAMDLEAKQKMLETCHISSPEKVNEILTVNNAPLKSDLDIFYDMMLEGKFDKSYANELAIDKKIAHYEYEKLIQENCNKVSQKKNIKNQMMLEFKENAEDDPRETSSCSTYDSNFEENEEFNEDQSSVTNIILKHKKSLRNISSQKNQNLLIRAPKVF
jgi:hypothetical protein